MRRFRRLMILDEDFFCLGPNALWRLVGRLKPVGLASAQVWRYFLHHLIGLCNSALFEYDVSDCSDASEWEEVLLLTPLPGVPHEHVELAEGWETCGPP